MVEEVVGRNLLVLVAGEVGLQHALAREAQRLELRED
jgi:hypothetical protein